MEPTGRLGVYVHVPFCASHCPYCDFSVVVTRSIPHERFGQAVTRELRERFEEPAGKELRTIYFGGGTPGLLDVRVVAQILDAIAGTYGNAGVRETTIELNPERTSGRHLRDLRAAGFDRVSFGVQSFDERSLAFLGRAHRRGEATAVVEAAARAGFRRVSVDLIYGVPGQSVRDAASDATTAVGLDGVDHVSSYELTWEPRSAILARAKRGARGPRDEGALVEIADGVAEALERGGLVRYEVSNWARAGGESIHNGAYWEGDEYLGIGPGAHSLRVRGAGDGVERSWNTRNLWRWMDDPAGERACERLAPAHHLLELVMVGVRRTAGIDFGALRARFGAQLEPLLALAGRWSAAGWGAMVGERFVPSSAGLRLADRLGADALALHVP